MDCIEFVKSPIWKKVIRTAIGVSVGYGIKLLFDLVNQHNFDDMSFFLVGTAIPMFLISFLIHGPFINLCSLLRLVGETKPQQAVRSYSNMSTVKLKSQATKMMRSRTSAASRKINNE